VQGRSAVILAVLVLAPFLSAGCGSRGGVPKGAPTQVVRASAARAMVAGTARLIVDGPDGRHSEGVVDLKDHAGTLTVSAPGFAASATMGGHVADRALDRPEYTDPLAVLELVRYATHVDPFGGLLVRGAGTVRYDVDIAQPGERPFYADVYVDPRGRVRRLTVPEDRADHRVTDRDVRLARQITIDVVFG
jgi:hypothetical protein